MKPHSFICIALSLLLMGCDMGQERTPKDVVPITQDSLTPPAEGASIMEQDGRLNQADSIVFVFYKDPHGTDSLRYTRYYREYHTTDTGLINLLKGNLQNSTERFEKIKNCRSEGKIWCFSKGEIFQTVYFSTQKEACSFVYIIRNGQFYYSDLTESLAQKLSELKPLAREPANSGQ